MVFVMLHTWFLHCSSHFHLFCSVFFGTSSIFFALLRILVVSTQFLLVSETPQALIQSQGETSLLKVAMGRYGSFVVVAWTCGGCGWVVDEGPSPCKCRTMGSTYTSMIL